MASFPASDARRHRSPHRASGAEPLRRRRARARIPTTEGRRAGQAPRRCDGPRCKHHRTGRPRRSLDGPLGLRRAYHRHRRHARGHPLPAPEGLRRGLAGPARDADRHHHRQLRARPVHRREAEGGPAAPSSTRIFYYLVLGVLLIGAVLVFQRADSGRSSARAGMGPLLPGLAIAALVDRIVHDPGPHPAPRHALPLASASHRSLGELVYTRRLPRARRVVRRRHALRRRDRAGVGPIARPVVRLVALGATTTPRELVEPHAHHLGAHARVLPLRPADVDRHLRRLRSHALRQLRLLAPLRPALERPSTTSRTTSPTCRRRSSPRRSATCSSPRSRT